MVLIGPNGSGKTALLEVFTLLRDAASERLGEALADRGGINDILFAGGAESLAVRITGIVDTWITRRSLSTPWRSGGAAWDMSSSQNT
jgi:predicted ATPase